MRVLIHAVPKRMWYVENFLVPSLRAQGIEPVIWNDDTGYGNLESCLRSFAAGLAEWHLQDDVLIARDFRERAEPLEGIVNGFCHAQSGDDKHCVGEVYMPDLWMGFPCVRIPIEIAQEFVEWIKGEFHTDGRVVYNLTNNRGDDFLFHEFLQERHGRETATNISLVEHVDWLIGGSMVTPWRGYICRSDLWDDEELVEDLEARIEKYKAMN